MALILIAASASSMAPEKAIILGVLEENVGHYFGEPNYRDIRVVFKKEGDDWKPFPNDCSDQACLKTVTSAYPREIKWTIAFDGKNLGDLTSHSPDEFHWYADVGQQKITGGSPPTIGMKSAEFGGFSGAAVYRPLIANSQPYLKDPENWRPSQLPLQAANTLRQAFRKKFPKLCQMTDAENGKLEPLSYRNEQVKVGKSYASHSGWILARLQLNAVDCDDLEAGFGIDDPWFVVSPQGSVTYLDSGIWLVDAGDYDNDGKSELLFSINRYNEGGYEIYYSDFKKHATFSFHYH